MAAEELTAFERKAGSNIPIRIVTWKPISIWIVKNIQSKLIR